MLYKIKYIHVRVTRSCIWCGCQKAGVVLVFSIRHLIIYCTSANPVVFVTLLGIRKTFLTVALKMIKITS